MRVRLICPSWMPANFLTTSVRMTSLITSVMDVMVLFTGLNSNHWFLCNISTFSRSVLDYLNNYVVNVLYRIGIFTVIQGPMGTDTMMPRLAKMLPQPQTVTSKLHTSPLVIKLLFNYNYLASVNQIWWDNDTEVVPVIDRRLFGKFRALVFGSSV